MIESRCQVKTIYSMFNRVKTLFTYAVLIGTLYSEACTKFPASIPVPPEYVSPLTTDISEVLLDDTTDYYLTWE